MVVNCETVWKEISNYIEGDVDRALRGAMDEHLRSCKRCTSVLEGTRNVIQLYGDERMIEVPAGFGRRLESRLRQQARAPRSTWSKWSAWLVPVAALALITGGLRWANSLSVAHPLRSQHAQPGHEIPPEMPVVVSEGAKEFHVAGCKFIHNKDKIRTLTAGEAIREGYVPCVRCMRKYLHAASVSEQSEESEADSQPADVEETRARGQ